tara:strand:+ start:925 stop:1221 length:297 start_codon:yes stop_codon:yes gene_type:complete
MSIGVGTVAREHLKAFVARIERLTEDKKQVMDDMKEVYAEAKAMGYDTKILRRVIALRKIDRNERAEAEALLDLYLTAIDEPPLFRARTGDAEQADAA